MSAIGEQMQTIEPTYPNPSCYWRGDKRVAVLFHRDRAGEEVLKIIGNSSRVDHLARLLAAESQQAPIDGATAETVGNTASACQVKTGGQK